MMNVWIDRNGRRRKGHHHAEIARSLFPHSINPERSCESAGYVKVSVTAQGALKMLNAEEEYISQAQTNTI